MCTLFLNVHFKFWVLKSQLYLQGITKTMEVGKCEWGWHILHGSGHKESIVHRKCFFWGFTVRLLMISTAGGSSWASLLKKRKVKIIQVGRMSHHWSEGVHVCCWTPVLTLTPNWPANAVKYVQNESKSDHYRSVTTSRAPLHQLNHFHLYWLKSDTFSLTWHKKHNKCPPLSTPVWMPLNQFHPFCSNPVIDTVILMF